MRVLLDTNIIVDILSRRQPFFQNSYDCLVQIFSNGDEPCITSACVTDVVYVLRKYIADKATLLSSVENFMDLVTVLDTKYSTVKMAFSFALKDYEDAVVIQSAIENGISAIISRNKNDFINAPISAFSPDEFLQQH